MNNLQSYIQESIFDKDVEKKIRNTTAEILLNDLKKYAYDNQSEVVRRCSPWEVKGSKIYVRDGKIWITGKGFAELHISGIPSQEPPRFNIEHVDGNVMIYDNKITTLEGIFTKNCVVEGIVEISRNDNLKNLEHLPISCQQFIISNKVNGPLTISTLFDLDAPWTDKRNLDVLNTLPMAKNYIHWYDSAFNFTPRNKEKEMLKRFHSLLKKYYSKFKYYPYIRVKNTRYNIY